jgi:hypothetical protein
VRSISFFYLLIYLPALLIVKIMHMSPNDKIIVKNELETTLKNVAVAVAVLRY